MPFRHAGYWLRRNMAPSLGAAMVNLSAIVCITAALYVLWGLIQPAPIVSVTTVSVDPENRVIDRPSGGTLSVQRRVCATREVEVKVRRLWIDSANGITTALDDVAFFQPGCHVRPPIRVTPPPSLNEGLHRYRVNLIWTNGVRTVETHLPDVEVVLVGPPRPDFTLPQQDRF